MGSYTEAPHSSPVRTTEVVEGLISTVMRFRSWFSTWARGHGLYTMVNKTALISQWAPQATVHATKLNRPTCWVSDGTHLHSYGTHRFRATPISVHMCSCEGMHVFLPLCSSLFLHQWRESLTPVVDRRDRFPERIREEMQWLVRKEPGGI